MKDRAPIRAVVYDLDGTLVDSMPMVLKAFAHALEPHLPPLPPMELFARLGGPPDRTFRDLLGDEVRAADALRRLIEFSRANWRLIQPFDGMSVHLDDVRAARRTVALWTGRERESTEWILREQQLNERLHTVICGDDLPTHKPHPGGLQEIMRRLSLEPREMLFVGDADVDVLAGAEAGIRTILILHGREVGQAVLEKAWLVVDSPAEAYAAVSRMLEDGRV